MIAGLERPVHQKGHGDVSNQVTVTARVRIHAYQPQLEQAVTSGPTAPRPTAQWRGVLGWGRGAAPLDYGVFSDRALSGYGSGRPKSASPQKSTPS